MKIITLIIVMVLLFSNSVLFAENPEKRLTPAEKEAETGGVVYYGMTREDLCDLYMHFLNQEHWREGDIEWITFSGCPTEDPTDTITFRLEYGKVKDWHKGQRRP